MPTCRIRCDEASRRALNRLEQSGVALFDLLDRLEREFGDGRRAPARTD